MLKNKKGFIIDPVILTSCFVAFFIIGLIFYFLFSSVGRLGTYNIVSEEFSSTADYGLLNYLRTPVEVDGNKINMADLINLYYNDKSYDEILTEKTKKILETFPKPVSVSGWNLNVYTMPEDKTLIKIRTLNILGWYENRKTFAYIPLSNEPEKYLKIKLYLECQDIACE